MSEPVELECMHWYVAVWLDWTKPNNVQRRRCIDMMIRYRVRKLDTEAIYLSTIDMKEIKP